MQEPQISPSEWEVMRVVWTSNPITSKEINTILNEKKDWKLATTKTLIGRLVKKGMLSAEPNGRKFEYSPAVSEEKSVEEATESLLKQVCSKKAGSTIQIMLENSTLSMSDLEALEDVIRQKKETAPLEVECGCIPGQCSCVH
ncbi:MAG: CopY/TcrY family copper transport repressor [Alkalibacterium sp.]|nr:CopY/TcrY family copper transport repressor [Alkalibacterium sp.]